MRSACSRPFHTHTTLAGLLRRAVVRLPGMVEGGAGRSRLRSPAGLKPGVFGCFAAPQQAHGQAHARPLPGPRRHRPARPSAPRGLHPRVAPAHGGPPGGRRHRRRCAPAPAKRRGPALRAQGIIGVRLFRINDRIVESPGASAVACTEIGPKLPANGVVVLCGRKWGQRNTTTGLHPGPPPCGLRSTTTPQLRGCGGPGWMGLHPRPPPLSDASVGIVECLLRRHSRAHGRFAIAAPAPSGQPPAAGAQRVVRLRPILPFD